MRSPILTISTVVALCGAIVTNAGPALAQTGFVTGTQPMSNSASNLPGQEVRPEVAPSLPSPTVTGNLPSDFLRAAQGALAAGRTGEAQQAMEMAQTRLLDRSVPLGQTNVPASNPIVTQISQALRELGSRRSRGQHADATGGARRDDRAGDVIAGSRAGGTARRPHRSVVDELGRVQVDRRELVLLGPVVLVVHPLRLVATLRQQVHAAHHVARIEILGVDPVK